MCPLPLTGTLPPLKNQHWKLRIPTGRPMTNCVYFATNVDTAKQNRGGAAHSPGGHAHCERENELKTRAMETSDEDENER